jgi:hypothetical protein
MHGRSNRRPEQGHRRVVDHPADKITFRIMLATFPEAMLVGWVVRRSGTLPADRPEGGRSMNPEQVLKLDDRELPKSLTKDGWLARAKQLLLIAVFVAVALPYVVALDVTYRLSYWWQQHNRSRPTRQT